MVVLVFWESWKNYKILCVGVGPPPWQAPVWDLDPVPRGEEGGVIRSDPLPWLYHGWPRKSTLFFSQLSSSFFAEGSRCNGQVVCPFDRSRRLALICVGESYPQSRPVPSHRTLDCSLRVPCGADAPASPCRPWTLRGKLPEPWLLPDLHFLPRLLPVPFCRHVVRWLLCRSCEPPSLWCLPLNLYPILPRVILKVNLFFHFSSLFFSSIIPMV